MAKNYLGNIKCFLIHIIPVGRRACGRRREAVQQDVVMQRRQLKYPSITNSRLRKSERGKKFLTNKFIWEYLGTLPSFSSTLLARTSAPRQTRYNCGSWMSWPSMKRSMIFTARWRVAMLSPSFSWTSQHHSTRWRLLASCGDCLLHLLPLISFSLSQARISPVYSLPMCWRGTITIIVTTPGEGETETYGRVLFPCYVFCK